MAVKNINENTDDDDISDDYNYQENEDDEEIEEDEWVTPPVRLPEDYPNIIEEDEEEDEDDIPDMNTFTSQEKDLLPIGYFKGPNEQWMYVLRAIESNFTSVKNLSKVSDNILRLVADVVSYSLEKTTPRQIHQEILNYAIQRNV
jgi:hypothetical protein